jgi:hypothetical protein
MSIYFKKSNAETTQELFEKRLIFDIRTKNPLHTNLVDFNFAEKKLYGKVDRLYIPISVANRVLTVKTSPYSAEPASPGKGLNFVIDAFSELNQEFVKAGISNKISDGDKYLSNLRIYKGFQSPHRLYREHTVGYKQGISQVISGENIRFLNFRNFIGKVMPYIENSTREIAFTFPGFIKSKECPATATGLVLEIADLEYDNDEEKIEKFYSSPNWEFYLNACAKYGFMVDQHIPWRLVADIGSPVMLTYAAKYYVHNTETVLSVAYEKSHTRYFKKFKNLLYEMYAGNRPRRLSGTTYIKNNSKTVTYTPVEYTPESLFRQYNDLYFLKIYCQIRFFEEESSFTDNQKERLIEQTLELANINLARALDIFEIILNKTFDYHGSLTYIIKAAKDISE